MINREQVAAIAFYGMPTPTCMSELVEATPMLTRSNAYHSVRTMLEDGRIERVQGPPEPEHAPEGLRWNQRKWYRLTPAGVKFAQKSEVAVRELAEWADVA